MVSFRRGQWSHGAHVSVGDRRGRGHRADKVKLSSGRGCWAGVLHVWGDLRLEQGRLRRWSGRMRRVERLGRSWGGKGVMGWRGVIRVSSASTWSNWPVSAYGRQTAGGVKAALYSSSTMRSARGWGRCHHPQMSGGRSRPGVWPSSPCVSIAFGVSILNYRPQMMRWQGAENPPAAGRPARASRGRVSRGPTSRER